MKRLVIGAMAAALALAAGAGTAAAAPSIQPRQSFVGVVNGRSVSSLISVTGCSTAAGNGHPIAGQSAKVLQLAASTAIRPGFTGRAHQISVDLYIPASDPMLPLIRIVHLGNLSAYQTPLFISPFLTLPCQGTASAVFSPINGGAKAVDASVSITFVSPQIAANPSRNIPAGTVTTLTGSGFAPNATYHVAECSQTGWMVTQNPCVAANAIDVTTNGAGGFTHPLTVEPCTVPSASTIETCFIGVPMVSGIDTIQLVAPARITVMLTPARI
ncbi:MAG: Neocarzinostatin family [Acidimicrobiaceae bacterium]|nr:Neocarzinostatin family [Acidimicrobiaceae bacterium]